MDTIRKQIIDLLSEMEMTAIDLSRELGISEKNLPHLPHVAHTAKATGKTLIIIPSKCETCGYEFSGRKRFTKPGKCPTCRSTHVQKPQFVIE